MFIMTIGYKSSVDFRAIAIHFSKHKGVFVDYCRNCMPIFLANGTWGAE